MFTRSIAPVSIESFKWNKAPYEIKILFELENGFGDGAAFSGVNFVRPGRLVISFLCEF